jgi:hypothetical protein
MIEIKDSQVLGPPAEVATPTPRSSISAVLRRGNDDRVVLFYQSLKDGNQEDGTVQLRGMTFHRDANSNFVAFSNLTPATFNG